MTFHHLYKIRGRINTLTHPLLYYLGDYFIITFDEIEPWRVM